MRKDMVQIMSGFLPTPKNLILRRRISSLLLFSLLIVSLCGCSILRWNPRGDWQYSDLPNGYSLYRVNSESIELCYHTRGTNAQSFLPTYISAICNNERYIAVRWTDPNEIDFENIEDHDFSTAKYYIVDSSNDSIYGPFDSEEEFVKQCEELSVGALSEWISVFDMPEILGDDYYR